MKKLERTQQIIREGVKGASCLFLSGGEDSLLLAYLMRDYKIPVVTFAADWEKAEIQELERVVLELGLTLYTYPPRSRHIVPKKRGFTLVDEYGFSQTPLPVLRDIKPGLKCIADLDKRRFDNFDFGFTTVFVGALKSDKHELVGPTWFEEQKQMGDLTFIAPLFDWSKKEIRAALSLLSLSPIPETGDIALCTKCLRGRRTLCPATGTIIDPIPLDSQAATEAFKTKFGF